MSATPGNLEFEIAPGILEILEISWNLVDARGKFL